jgi:predicted nucleotidyltransferase
MLSDKVEFQIVEKLKSLSPVKIIIFGSYAYGQPTIDSDLDICIIKTEIKARVKEKLEIRKLLKEIVIPKDILLSSIDEYEFYKNQFGSVFMDIDKKGKVIWANS